MAEAPTPFERIFDPDRKSITGIIGTALGHPTAAMRAGSDTSEALSAVSRAVQEEGLPLNKAIIGFFSSPQGQDIMSRGTVDFPALLKQFQSIASPPAPVTLTGRPGETTGLFDPETGQQRGAGISVPAAPIQRNSNPGDSGVSIGPDGRPIEGSQTYNPTAPLQNLIGFAKLGGMAPARMSELADYSATPPEMRDKAPQIRAINEAQRDGFLSPKEASDLKTGRMKMTKFMTASGTEQFWIEDQATGTGRRINPMVTTQQLQPGAASAAGGQGAQAPNEVGSPPISQGSAIPKSALKPDGSIDWNQVDNKTTMALGVGANEIGKDITSRVMEQVGGPQARDKLTPEGKVIAERRNNLKTLEYHIDSLTDRSNDLGTPKQLIADAKAMIETLSVAGSADVSMTGMIKMHRELTAEVSREQYSYENDFSVTKTNKDKQFARIQAYKGILGALPNPDDVTRLQADYRAGKTGVGGIAGTAGYMLNAVGNVPSLVMGSEGEPGAPRQPRLSPATQKEIQTLRATVPKMDEDAFVRANRAIKNTTRANLPEDVKQMLADKADEFVAAKRGQQPAPGPAAPAQRPVSQPPGRNPNPDQWMQYSPGQPRQAPTMEEFTRNPAGGRQMKGNPVMQALETMISAGEWEDIPEGVSLKEFVRDYAKQKGPKGRRP